MLYNEISKFEYDIIPIFHDEIYFSWFGRLHSLSGNSKYHHTVKDLLGFNSLKTNICHPVNLDHLCSQLPSFWNITSDLFIEKHTIFPFFKPFLTDEISSTIISGMKNKRIHNLKEMMGVNSGNIFNMNIIKVCPDCLRNDANHYTKEGYLRRIHQVPGNFVCLEHEKLLIQKTISNPIIDNSLFDVNKHQDSFLSFEGYTKIDSQELVNISIDIDSIMRGVLKNENLLSIRKKLSSKLQILGYKSHSGLTIDRKALLNDFLSFYSKDFLINMKSYIETPDDNWIAKITTERKVKVHPIRFLLLIRFLFGGVNEFSSYYEEYKPFGKGPFPCLNPAANHYKELTITSCNLEINRRSKKLTGRFPCECGFIYSRTNGDSGPENEIKKFRVLKHGSIWEDKLKELILSGKYRAKKIGNILHSNRETVIRKASNLGLANLLSENYSSDVKLSYTEINNQKLDKHKTNIINYISQNSTATRTDISKALSTSYTILLRKDRTWLETVLPPRLNKSITSNNALRVKNWTLLDLKSKTSAINAVNEILKAYPPIRITKGRIALVANNYLLEGKKFLANIPLTHEFIQKSLETKKDFWKRSIPYIVKNAIESGNIITDKDIYYKLNMKPDERIEFEEFINNTINQIKAIDS